MPREKPQVSHSRFSQLSEVETQLALVGQCWLGRMPEIVPGELTAVQLSEEELLLLRLIELQAEKM